MAQKHCKDMTVDELIECLKSNEWPEDRQYEREARIVLRALLDAAAAKLGAAFAPIKLKGEVASNEELDLWRKCAREAERVGNGELPIPRLMKRYDQDIEKLKDALALANIDAESYRLLSVRYSGASPEALREIQARCEGYVAVLRDT